MNKRKKVIGGVCLLIVIVISIFSVLIVAPKIHIAKKYDISFSELYIEKIHLPHLSFSETYHPDGSKAKKAVTDMCWDIKYNGKDFKLVFYKGFYDDFQLEEIEEWGIQYFQNNLDKNIVGIELIGFTNSKAYMHNPFMEKEYINKNEKQEIFFKYASTTLFYKITSMDDINNELKNKIKNELWQYTIESDIQHNIYNVIFIDNNIQLSRIYNNRDVYYGMNSELQEGYQYQIKVDTYEIAKEK